MKLIPFFRAGRHLDNQGRAVEFSETELAASIAGYDPALHRAPLVIGHPKDNGPAFGWVQSLGRNAKGEATAVPEQLNNDFAEGVAAGTWYPRSASWYAPTDPRNPKPGIYYLRHIGFLGAQPPSIKGLSDIEFDDGAGVLEIEFSDFGHEASANLWRRLRDWLIGERGLDVADQVVPDWQIGVLAEVARTPAEPSHAFNEPTNQPTVPEETTVKPEEIAALQEENTRLKAQATQHLEAQKKKALEITHAGNVSFAEQLIGDGKLLPKHAEALIAALDFAESGDTPLEFGEGDQRQPVVDGLKAIFGDLPKQISFAEQASKVRQAGGQLTHAELEFAEVETDPDRLKLHSQATQLASEKNIPYESAVRQLINQ